MDEEELEQPSSKINLGSFFERVDSIEKVSNNALSRANANLGIINNQKLIINSLNVTIEAMETKIRDIANYIIIEKKLEKDIEEDRALEERDRLQKQAMVERATTIMGEPGPQGEQGQPAEQQKGGSLLGTLLKLGIGAFALKFLWPALLPLLKGSLAALGKLVFSKLGAGIGAAVGGTLLSLPLLRRFKDPFQKKSEELGDGVGEFVAQKVNSIDDSGNVDASSGGQVVSESNVDINDKNVDDLEDTLIEKDLVKGKPIKNKRGRIIGYEKVEETEVVEDEVKIEDKEIKDDKKKFEVIEGEQNITADQLKREIAAHETKIEKMEAEGKNTEIIEMERDEMEMKKQTLLDMKSGLPVDAKTKYRIVEPIKSGTEELDLSTNDIGSNLTKAVALTNERIDNQNGGENLDQNTGNLVSANKPNVTEATLKLAAAPLPFVKVIKNNQLSTSPKSYNGLPPEIAAMIS